MNSGLKNTFIQGRDIAMRKNMLRFTACAVAAGMALSGGANVALAAGDTTLAGFGTAKTKDEVQEVTGQVVTGDSTETNTQETEAEVVETEAVYDDSMSGEMAFAQCEEYINVRTDADTDSEVVGKVYNNGSVTILGQLGDWYEVQSGNVTGYVSKDYFATGAEAEAIANDTAYNVATVYSDALMVRADASEDAETIGTVYANEELEVVDYEGDWMKVALGGDSYGYINANYVGYDTYYSTAETLEEEQARLDEEWLEYLAEQEAIAEAEAAAAQQAEWDASYYEESYDDSYYTDSYSDTSYYDYSQATADAQQAAWDAEYQAQAAAEAAQSASYATADAQSNAEAAYQTYLDAQAAADAATASTDEQAVYDAAAAAEAAYAAYVTAQAEADAQAQAEADAAYQAEVAAQAQAEAEAAAQTAAAEETYAETYTDSTTDSYTETYTEDTSSTTSYSSTGQAIVEYALQFVGNPYVYGGTSLTDGADCSGFTQSVMASFGISIPRTAAAQSESGTPVSLSDIQAGDLLFYEGSGGIGHVTIYMGNGQVVHASNSSTGIIVSDYSYRTPVSARRYWS